MDMMRVPSPFRAVAAWWVLAAGCLLAPYFVYCACCTPCFIECPCCFQLTAAEASLLRAFPGALVRYVAPRAAAAAAPALLLPAPDRRRRALALIALVATIGAHDVLARFFGLYFVTASSADRVGSHDTVVRALAVVGSVFACVAVLSSIRAVLRGLEYVVLDPFRTDI